MRGCPSRKPQPANQQTPLLARGRRCDLIRGDGDPTLFLTTTTIWGYGTFGRGPRALRAMLAGPNVAATINTIVDASRSSASDGFGALFDGRGRSRIAYLGIAFGTKVVHFAGYA